MARVREESKARGRLRRLPGLAEMAASTGKGRRGLPCLPLCGGLVSAAGTVAGKGVALKRRRCCAGQHSMLSTLPVSSTARSAHG